MAFDDQAMRCKHMVGNQDADRSRDDLGDADQPETRARRIAAKPARWRGGGEEEVQLAVRRRGQVPRDQPEVLKRGTFRE